MLQFIKWDLLAYSPIRWLLSICHVPGAVRISTGAVSDEQRRTVAAPVEFHVCGREKWISLRCIRELNTTWPSDGWYLWDKAERDALLE